jgi:phage protein U
MAVFLQIGRLQVEGLNAPSSWSEAHEAKYGEIPHIGRKPSVQFVGEELVNLSLLIRLSQYFGNPDVAISYLKEAKSTGEILPLITGAGVLIGRFVLKSIDINIRKANEKGELISADLTLDLGEYVAPPGIETRNPNEGTALSGNGAISMTPARPIMTNERSMMNDIQEASSNVSKLRSSLKTVQNGTKLLKRGVRDAKNLANATRNLYTSAQTKLNQAEKIAKRATRMPASLDEAIAYADNLARLDNLAQLDELERNTDNLSKAAERVTNNLAVGAAFVGTRET